MTEFKDCSIVYIPFANKTIDKQPSFRRMLEIFGLNFDRLKAIEQPTQFDKIILPDESFFSKTNSSQREFTKEYRETINRIRDFALKNRKPVANKKVYYFHGRNQIGEFCFNAWFVFAQFSFPSRWHRGNFYSAKD